jgi:hypothetical protein
MRYRFFLITAALLGCGPTVTYEPRPGEPAPADEPEVLDYCEQGTAGAPCARGDGVGVCFTAGVCSFPCGNVADCPEPWKPCLIVSCDAVEGLDVHICQYRQETPGC